MSADFPPPTVSPDERRPATPEEIRGYQRRSEIEQAAYQAEPALYRSLPGLAGLTAVQMGMMSADLPGRALEIASDIGHRAAGPLGEFIADPFAERAAKSSTAQPQTAPAPSTTNSKDLPPPIAQKRSAPAPGLADAESPYKMPQAWAGYHEAAPAAPIQILRDATGRVVSASNVGAPRGSEMHAPEVGPPAPQSETLAHTPDSFGRRMHDIVAAADAEMQGGAPGAVDDLFRQLSPAEQRLAQQEIGRNFPLMQMRQHEKEQAESYQAARAHAALGLEVGREQQRIEQEETQRGILQGKSPDEWVVARAKSYEPEYIQQGFGGAKGSTFPSLAAGDPAGRAAKLGAQYALAPTPEEQAYARRAAAARAQQELQNLTIQAMFAKARMFMPEPPPGR